MAIGSDGALYGMSYPSTVLRIGTDGTVTPVAQWTENESFYSGFTAAPDGRLYSVGGTGEFGYGSIIRFTPGVGLSRVVSFTFVQHRSKQGIELTNSAALVLFRMFGLKFKQLLGSARASSSHLSPYLTSSPQLPYIADSHSSSQLLPRCQ